MTQPPLTRARSKRKSDTASAEAAEDAERGNPKTTSIVKGKRARAEASSSKANKRRKGSASAAVKPYATNSLSKEQLVGLQCSVWWEGDQQFFPGVIAEYCADSGVFVVNYDDGDQDTSLNILEYKVEVKGRKKIVHVLKSATDESSYLIQPAAQADHSPQSEAQHDAPGSPRGPTNGQQQEQKGKGPTPDANCVAVQLPREDASPRGPLRARKQPTAAKKARKAAATTVRSSPQGGAVSSGKAGPHKSVESSSSAEEQAAPVKEQDNGEAEISDGQPDTTGGVVVGKHAEAVRPPTCQSAGCQQDEAAVARESSGDHVAEQQCATGNRAAPLQGSGGWLRQPQNVPPNGWPEDREPTQPSEPCEPEGKATGNSQESKPARVGGFSHSNSEEIRDGPAAAEQQGSGTPLQTGLCKWLSPPKLSNGNGRGGFPLYGRIPEWPFPTLLPQPNTAFSLSALSNGSGLPKPITLAPPPGARFPGGVNRPIQNGDLGNYMTGQKRKHGFADASQPSLPLNAHQVEDGEPPEKCHRPDLLADLTYEQIVEVRLKAELAAKAASERMGRIKDQQLKNRDHQRHKRSASNEREQERDRRKETGRDSASERVSEREREKERERVKHSDQVAKDKERYEALKRDAEARRRREAEAGWGTLPRDHRSRGRDQNDGRFRSLEHPREYARDKERVREHEKEREREREREKERERERERRMHGRPKVVYLSDPNRKLPGNRPGTRHSGTPDRRMEVSGKSSRQAAHRTLHRCGSPVTRAKEAGTRSRSQSRSQAAPKKQYSAPQEDGRSQSRDVGGSSYKKQQRSASTEGREALEKPTEALPEPQVSTEMIKATSSEVNKREANKMDQGKDKAASTNSSSSSSSSSDSSSSDSSSSSSDSGSGSQRNKPSHLRPANRLNGMNGVIGNGSFPTRFPPLKVGSSGHPSDKRHCKDELKRSNLGTDEVRGSSRRVEHQPLAPPESLVPADKRFRNGRVFVCSGNELEECKRRKVVGGNRPSDVHEVDEHTAIFLYNADTKELAGIYCGEHRSVRKPMDARPFKYQVPMRIWRAARDLRVRHAKEAVGSHSNPDSRCPIPDALGEMQVRKICIEFREAAKE